MEIKKNIIFLYTIHKQLQIPCNRYVYNLYCNAISLFEINKQETKNYIFAYNIKYTLYSSQKERIRRLHFLLENFNSFCLVFIDGNPYYLYSNNLLSLSLSKAFYLKKYAREIDISYEKYLSKRRSSLSLEGIFIYIPKGLFIETTIDILSLSIERDNKNLLFPSRNLIFLGKGSCVRIIERTITLNPLIIEKENSFLNSITDIYMNSYSYLDICNIRCYKFITYLLYYISILQENRSECSMNTFLYYGNIIMNNIYIYQLKKESHTYINSLIINQNYINHNSFIEHVSSFGRSRDIYKGIYNKISNTTFYNKIIILNSAKRTNAVQNGKILLFPNKIRININPQLEIFTRNVKCSHGCIIGFLRDEEIFYLSSRGIPKTIGIKKLLLSFVKDILECLFFLKLRNLIRENIKKNVIYNRNK